jgi:hypothetical protein
LLCDGKVAEEDLEDALLELNANATVAQHPNFAAGPLRADEVRTIATSAIKRRQRRQNDDPELEGLTRTRDGRPEGTLRNAVLAIRDRYGAALGYDELRQATMTRSPLPWPGGEVRHDWSDADDVALMDNLQAWGLPVRSKEAVHDAVEHVARERRFHPIRDYLDGLAWDGTPRLDGWLHAYLGAEDTPYARAVGPKVLMAGVARALRPGCKVDNLLMLEGPQGAGKSRAVMTLAGGQNTSPTTCPRSAARTPSSSCAGGGSSSSPSWRGCGRRTSS